MRSLFRNAAVTACLLATTAFAHADYYIYYGDTTGNDTFHRPSSRTTLSTEGSDVSYHEFKFIVDTEGAYTLWSSTTSYNGYILLYSIFNPAYPLANLIAVNDDSVDTRHSNFTVYLQADTKYVFINTAFSNNEAGYFTGILEGPGTITPIPEPATYAMLAAGLALLGFATRRKRTAV